MTKLKLIFYDNQFTAASEGEAVEMSWQEFRDEILRSPEQVSQKGNETQYFLGAMKPNSSSKGDSSVDRVYAVGLDLDEITDDQLAHIRNTMESEKLEGVLHSTYSHSLQRKKDGRNRVRLILPTARPVLPGEFRIFWANLRVLFGNCADPATAHISKHYLVPSIPPGEEGLRERIYEEFTGSCVDVDSTISRYGIAHIAEAEVEDFELGKERITADMFRDVATRRRKGEETKVVAALRSALGRQSYAETGMREATLFSIAGLLAKEFPRGNPDDLCEPLRYSVEFEEKKGGPKFIEFRDKVIRRQRDILRRAAQKQLEAAKESAKAAVMRDRVEEFTPETLKEYLDSIENKIRFADLKQALVLVHQNNFYVFNGNGYSFATTKSLPATVRAYLLFRAENHLDFAYFFPSEGDAPPQPKTEDAFVRDHGDVVERILYNYLGVSYFDPTTKTLWLSEVENPDRLIPERCPKVEAWMRAFTGSDTALFRQWEDWLAQAPNVRQALVGLVLLGPSGIGKSAFAEGISLLFGNSPPCTMKNYVSSFNSEILANPFVFADESLPEVGGKIPTDTLRTMISSGKHEVNRKNRPIVILEGFLRAIMAFQNLKKFNFGRGHTREDVEAIQKRYLFIIGNEAAAELFDHDLFVVQKHIAKHALYLSMTRERTSPRFGVDTGGSSAVIAGDPVAMSVLDWIYEYLAGKVGSAADATTGSKKVSAFVNKGRVFVNVTQLRKNWDHYAPTKVKTTPNQATIVEAVRALSMSNQPHRVRIGQGQESYWEIDVKLLRKRVEDMDLCTPEKLELMLKIPHELQFKAKQFELTDAEKRERIECLKELGVGVKTA